MPRNAIKPFMLPDGQLRMITQGQELLVDYDEKTLAEVGFKDSQIVYVSVGASRMKKKGEGLETPSILPPPRREHIPTLLLLGPEYFETLFKLMHTLSTVPVKPGVSILTVSHVHDMNFRSTYLSVPFSLVATAAAHPSSSFITSCMGYTYLVADKSDFVGRIPKTGRI